MIFAAAVFIALILPIICGDIHIIFSTECTDYFDWQSNALLWSIKRTYTEHSLAIPKVTRLTACDDDKVSWDGFEEGWGGYSSSFNQFVHQTYNKGGGDCSNNDPQSQADCNSFDIYPAYNKPGSILSWLASENPSEKYIVTLDADQIIRFPITTQLVESLGVSIGIATSARYDYLNALDKNIFMGVKDRMLRTHDKQQQTEIESRFSKVGGFFIHTLEDLKKLSPNWLHYTRQVRSSKDSWSHTGDIFNCKSAPAGCTGLECNCEKPPWISEMYGYALASAEAGISHKITDTLMAYPGYDIPVDAPFGHPAVVHYGLLYGIEYLNKTINGDKQYWCFDKHRYSQRESPMKCPDSDRGGHRVIFNEPPHLSDIVLSSSSKVSFECAWTIANATIDYLTSKCFGIDSDTPLLRPLSSQSKCSCKMVSGVFSCDELKSNNNNDNQRTTFQTEDPDVECTDVDKRPGYCCDWSRSGECETNRGYMIVNCRRSCAFCLSAHSCLPEQRNTTSGNKSVSWDSRKVNSRGSSIPPSRLLVWMSASGWIVAALMFARIKNII